MSNYHIAFNTILTGVMEKIKNKAVIHDPSNKKLHSTIDLIIESPTINVHVPLDKFISEIYVKYRNPMYDGDETFFMNEDYSSDSPIINVIKSMYMSCSPEEKEELKSKVKKMVTITDKFLIYSKGN